jgi:hypothetical protein
LIGVEHLHRIAGRWTRQRQDGDVEAIAKRIFGKEWVVHVGILAATMAFNA